MQANNMWDKYSVTSLQQLFNNINIIVYIAQNSHVPDKVWIKKFANLANPKFHIANYLSTCCVTSSLWLSGALINYA